MHPQLQKQWEGLQEGKMLVEGEIQKASLLQQQFKPHSKSWNMLQVMAHLLAAEKSGFDYLLKKNYSNTRKTNGKMHVFRAYFLRLMLASPLKFKVPVPSLHPPDICNFQDLQKEWGKERTTIEHYLEHFPENKMGHLIFRHPLLGWLTIGQTLAFYKDHIRHHRQQIKRIKSATGYPR